MLPSGRRVALSIAVLVSWVSSAGFVAHADEPVAPAQPAPEVTTVVEGPAPVVQSAPAVVASVPVVQETTANADRKDEIPRPSYKLCIGIGAGAIAALIAGGVLGGVAHARQSDQNGDVNSPPLYTQALIDQGKQAQTIAMAGYIFLGIGGALAIADVVLWVERLRKPQKKQVQADATRPVTQAPKISATMSGLQVTF